MNPKHLLHDLVEGTTYVRQYPYPLQGYIQRRLAAGEELPDDCLPGRAYMKLNPVVRARLAQLKGGDLQNVAKWWIDIMCGRPGFPADIEAKMTEIERGYSKL